MPSPRPPSSSGSSIASQPCSAMADHTASSYPVGASGRRLAGGGPGAGQRPDDRSRPDPGPERVRAGHLVEQRRRGVTQGLLVA